MKKVAFIVGGLLLGCGGTTPERESCGEPGANRCGPGDSVQLCGPNGKWMEVMTCPQVGPTWKCSVSPEGAVCLEGL